MNDDDDDDDGNDDDNTFGVHENDDDNDISMKRTELRHKRMYHVLFLGASSPWHHQSVVIQPQPISYLQP